MSFAPPSTCRQVSSAPGFSSTPVTCPEQRSRFLPRGPLMDVTRGAGGRLAKGSSFEGERGQETADPTLPQDRNDGGKEKVREGNKLRVKEEMRW